MRRSSGWLLLSLLAALSVGGCSKSEAPAVTASAPAASEAKAPDVAKRAVDPAQTGTIHGVVSFEGSAPEAKMLSVKGNPECAALHEGGMIASEEVVVADGKLKNVLVYPKTGLEGYAFDTPQTAIEIDNKNCTYVPHVSVAMAGQEVIFLNGDSTLHNVHSYPKHSKSFNLGLPLVGMKQSKRISEPEIAVALKCDVHPWMLGYLAVLPHPIHAVTAADGSFELTGVPAGTYEIEAWHEKLGTRTQSVTVAAGQTSDVTFSFTAAS